MDHVNMKQLFIISIAALLLFVVVCPLTPTPQALLNGKVQFQQLDHAAIVVSCLAAIVILSRLSILVHSDEFVTRGVSQVIELTCARLC